MIMKRSTYHNFLTIASVLLVLIPLALVSGPFLPDLFIVFISIIFLFISSSNKELNLFQSNFFKLFLLFYLYLILTSLLSNNFYQSHKSIYNKNTPLSGGIFLFLTLSISVFFIEISKYSFLICAFLLFLLILGIISDLRSDFSPKLRLFLQFIIIFLFIYFFIWRKISIFNYNTVFTYDCTLYF